MADFAKQMQKWAKKTERDIGSVTEEIITELCYTITYRTPVQTLWLAPRLRIFEELLNLLLVMYSILRTRPLMLGQLSMAGVLKHRQEW